MKTFIEPDGLRVTTSNQKEIKMMKACGWRKVKEPKIYFANGNTTGSRFLK